MIERLVLGLVGRPRPARARCELATSTRSKREITACRACPRLVEWREHVAREKRAAFRDWDYWGRPVPGFGDPSARVLIVGLAPAAHGANRTGRMFTGDRSGDCLFAALHRTGFANQPTSVHARRRPGAARLLDHRRGALRAARQQAAPNERDAACRSWSASSRCSPRVRVVVCLGAFAWDGRAARARRRRAAVAAAAAALRPRRRAPRRRLLGCFHPSQQNTFTGKLTPAMLDGVLVRARERVAGGGP